MSDVIRLGQPSKVTNVIKLGSALPISPKGITLITPKRAGQILSSPKTTVALAGTLGTLLGGPIAGIKAAALTGLAAGALQTSPFLQKKAIEKIKDPTAAGRFVGEQIEKVATGQAEKDLTTTKEKITEGLKKAGVIGGVAAGGVAAAVATKKIIEKVKKTKEQIIDVEIPTTTLPSVSPITRQTTPLGSVQPSPAIPEKAIQTPKAVEKTPKPMKISQNVNIKVNQKVYKRRNALIEYGIYA